MKTLFIGKNLIELDSVESTNNYAADLYRTSDLAEGTVVMTHFQASGRGQRGNSWQSNPGENLLFSILLNPGFIEVKNSFLLSKIIALGICEYLESVLNKQVHIKWPNDILVNNKKICGVLIENQFKGSKIENSIIGIGFNVNQLDFGELKSATSMKLVTCNEFNLQTVLEGLLSYIESCYIRARMKKTQEIEVNYLNNLLYYNEFRKYKVDEELITGKITGVMPDGKLKVELESGLIQLFSFKEIEFIL